MNFAERSNEEQRQARMQSLGLTQQLANSDHALLEGLRRLMPRRRLAWSEAVRIAERQADYLRTQLDLTDTPRFPISRLSNLSFLSFTNRGGFPTSGMAVSSRHGWTIVIRSDEAKVRRRYTACHEFKHVLDDERMSQFDGELYRASRLYNASEIAERMADRFAAALLMPKKLLRRDWTEGLQDIGTLAHRYEVSRLAMSVRLSQLGLIEPAPRCIPETHGRSRS